MAGSSPDFNAADARANLRTVFDIFAPVDEADQATFYFPNRLVYNVGTDEDDVPFDRSALPVNQQQVAPVRLPCAVEYFDATGNLTDFGVMVPSRAVITMLDEDYHQIDGSQAGTTHFTFVMLRGEKFLYRNTEYPDAIFDMGLFTIHVYAEGER